MTDKPKTKSKPRKPKTVEIDAEHLKRIENTLLLHNRHHFGEETGRLAGQFSGNFVAGIFDPLQGLAQLCGFVEGLGKGGRKGFLTSKAIYLDANLKGNQKSLQAMERKLDSMREREAQGSQHFLDSEEMETLQRQVSEAEISSALT
jgi:hypothetical protein